MAEQPRFIDPFGFLISNLTQGAHEKPRATDNQDHHQQKDIHSDSSIRAHQVCVTSDNLVVMMR